MVVENLRRLAAAVRAGEYSGDMADDLETLATEAAEELRKAKSSMADAIGDLALDALRRGDSVAADAHMLAVRVAVVS